MNVTLETRKKKLVFIILDACITISIFAYGFYKSDTFTIASFIILFFFLIIFVLKDWYSIKEYYKPTKLCSFNENSIILYKSYHKTSIPWEVIQEIYVIELSKSPDNIIGFDLKIRYRKQFPKLLKKSRRMDKLKSPHLSLAYDKIYAKEICKIFNGIRKNNIEKRRHIIRKHFQNSSSQNIIFYED